MTNAISRQIIAITSKHLFCCFVYLYFKDYLIRTSNSIKHFIFHFLINSWRRFHLWTFRNIRYFKDEQSRHRLDWNLLAQSLKTRQRKSNRQKSLWTQTLNMLLMLRARLRISLEILSYQRESTWELMWLDAHFYFWHSIFLYIFAL